MTITHPLLRSINLVYDAAAPERIAHYEPTSKAVPFLEGVGGQRPQRAYFVIAPYGSGKSIAATYLLQLIENSPASTETVDRIGEKLEAMSPSLADFVKARRDTPDVHGVVLALDGATDDLGKAFASAAAASLRRIGYDDEADEVDSSGAAGSAGAISTIDWLVRRTQAGQNTSGIDRITILWDEFGRHVEQLVRSGQSHRLSEIQTLAEFAARSAAVPVTLGLILHQGLLQYASGLSQAALAEWRKIEGRFEAIQYVDDSRELYRLIAKVAAERRTTGDLFPPDAERAEQVLRLGLLPDLEQELPELLASAWPLEPATLHVLPRLAARVAQHERTLFGFLLSADFSRPVTPHQLYDYFAPAMQTDTVLGGTYRKWLETESALSKAESDAEVRALKTASILELGFSGERLRVSREVLEYALGGDSTARDTVSALLERKLLLHRRRTDQISLWHGTDVDLRARLDEELRRHGTEFDIVRELNREFRPPAFRPVRYNAQFCIRRFFAGEYWGTEAFRRRLKSGEPLVASGEDGRICYLVPEDERSHRLAHELARACDDPRVIVVVPRERIDLHAAAAEVSSLERLRQNEALLAEDPLVDQELQQMLDEAQGHLYGQLSRMTEPSPHTCWYYGGRELPVTNVATLLEALSDICQTNFPKTPRINNEMIVRHRLSAPLVNARKKVLLGVLERHGQERLGIEGEYADASVFRTVLLNTGLYRLAEDGSSYRYAEPRELRGDRNLREVWGRFRKLVTEPTARPITLAAFFEELVEPPYGLRRGVLPILFAAAFRAFQSALAITNDRGEYLDDLLPSDIEAICQAPERYSITVVELNEQARDYLRGIVSVFATDHGIELQGSTGDLIRAAYDAFEGWRVSVPPGARDTRFTGDKGRRLQTVIRAPFNPIPLFLKQFPQLAETNDLNAVLSWLTEAKADLDSVVSIYRTEALAALDDSLELSAGSPGEPVRLRFDNWRRMLPVETASQLGGRQPTSLFKLNIDFFSDDEAFIDAVATIVTDKRKPSRWDDSDLQRFRNEVSALISRIEAVAVAEASGADQAKPLTTLIERRLRIFAERLTVAVGPEEASRRVAAIMRELEKDHGDTRRSAGHG